MPAVGSLQCCYQLAAGDAGFLLFAGHFGVAAPLLITSANGAEWQTVAEVAWPGGRLDRIAGWDGQFLAAGVGGTTSEPRAALWTSPDGDSWQPLPASPDLRIPAVSDPDWPSTAPQIATAYAAGDNVTVVGEIWPDPCREGCDGPVAVYQWDTTDRGASWTRSKLRAEAFNHEPAIRIGDLWVRMDEYWDTIESSPDKKHWQSAWQSQGGPYAQPTRVRLTSVGAIAVGSVGDYEGGLILRSVDGVEWTQSVGWADLDAAAAVSDVAESGPAIVAVGYRFSGSSPQPYVLVRLP